MGEWLLWEVVGTIVAVAVVAPLIIMISKGSATFQLWSLQRIARALGLSVSLVIDEDNPKDSRWPTLITVCWIGWGRRRRASDVRGRSSASGFVPTEKQQAAYLRCKAAADRAWAESSEQEDWSP